MFSRKLPLFFDKVLQITSYYLLFLTNIETGSDSYFIKNSTFEDPFV
jgi:hypothetical protein